MPIQTNLSVEIVGHTATGKSYIAQVIKEALEAKGIQVDCLDDNSIGVVEHGYRDKETMGRITQDLIKRGTVIKVQTRLPYKL